MVASRHSCYRCSIESVDVSSTAREIIETIEGTFADNGDEVFFASGYGAREIAQKHARESSAQVYVNNVSQKIKRRDLSVPVGYAVSKSPVYTLKGPDNWHKSIYRAYWPPLS
jgi:hypothetical protein